MAQWSFSTLLPAILAARVAVVVPMALAALGVRAAAGRLLVGPRTPGRFNWDASSYQQRWQVGAVVPSLAAAVLLCAVLAGKGWATPHCHCNARRSWWP